MITNPTVQVFQNQKFHRFVDYDSGTVFSDLEFRNCEFRGCLVGVTKNPELRTTIRNVSLINCSDNGSSIGNAIVEDVLVENFKAPGLFQTFGAVFKHVILRGSFDRLMICNYELPDSSVNPPYQYEIVDAFREANAEYYRNVDWALDISEARVKELDIRGVPGHLIRRDPETQVLVTRQHVLDEAWRELPFKDSLTPFSLDFMLKEEMPDLVLIAPKRHRKFPLYLEDLQLLREAGIAEPD
jgi:hypothetical protein